MIAHVSVIDEEEKNVLTGSRYLTSTWNRTSKLDQTLKSPPTPLKKEKKKKLELCELTTTEPMWSL